jgi:hypothetical protein
MEHRYGRHGPRAWLRWRIRRYGRPVKLPASVVSQPTIIRVFTPINAERIIFIVVEAPQYSDQQNSSGGNQLTAGTPLTLMKQYGERQARRDIVKIKNLVEEEQLLFLRRDTIKRRNGILAQNLIWTKIYVDSMSPSNQDVENLISTYQQEYGRVFDEGIDYYQLESINDPHIANIRKIAMQDSIDFPASVRRRDESKFHQRDLGVIRVLLELGIDLEDAVDHLTEIHELADEYDEYCRNPRKGVNWPDDLEPFPELAI